VGAMKRLRGWLSERRWWESRLFWRFTLSYFLVTIIAIFITQFASRREGPFGFLRGTWINETFTRLFDNTTNSGLVFALMAMFCGTLAGLFLSYNLTRRLRRITQAAESWSRGNFAATVHDASNDELGQLAHDLNQMASQLQTLMTTQQALAVVEERNRLARDLHDSVKQQVFANALLVRAARKVAVRDPAQAQGYLEEAESLAERTQQELTALIRALRPAAIADKGLAELLRDYAADWSRRMGIAVRVQIHGERTTPLDIEEALYRVAEEALANIARHAGAQTVELRLTWDADALCLSVRDDGKGFVVAQAAGRGVGLASMRERMAALDGTLEITSTPQGTTLCAQVPLAAPMNTPMNTSGLVETPYD